MLLIEILPYNFFKIKKTQNYQMSFRLLSPQNKVYEQMKYTKSSLGMCSTVGPLVG